MSTTTAQTSTRAEQNPRSRSGRVLSVLRTALAVLGMAAVIVMAVGAIVDIANVDRTRGGYEPPFTGYTGHPIDWDADTYTTQSGMVATGYVLDVYTDCTTGMISFHILGLVSVDYRPVSDRAVAIHKPQLACIERGFDPDF